MKSSTTSEFWKSYACLPPEVKQRARKVYHLWKNNQKHPSLCFKKVGQAWSLRIDSGFRAMAILEGDTFYWFWIGKHDEYVKLIGQK